MSDMHVAVTDLAGIAGTARTTIKPGVNVLRGPNGSGKSSLAHALGARFRLGEIEIHDGCEWGVVTVDGAPMEVRRTGRGGTKAKVAAAAAAPMLEIPVSPVATLITGDGVGDPERANVRRLKALSEIYAAGVSAEALAAMVGGDEEIYRGLGHLEGRPLPDVVEEVRKGLNAVALDAEKEHQGVVAAVEVLTDQATRTLAEIGGQSAVTSTTAEGARAETDTLERKLAVLRQAREQRVRLEEQQAEIRGAEDPEPDVAGAAAKAREAFAAEGAAGAAVERLKRELHEAELAFKAARDKHEAVAAAENDAAIAHGKWTARRAILERPVEGPEQKTVDDLAAEVDVARKIEARAAKSDEYRRVVAESRERHGEAEVLERRAKTLRALVLALGDRVGEQLAALGIPDTEISTPATPHVEPGRLCARLEGGRLADVSSGKISSGQLVRWALRVGAPAMRSGFLDLTPARPGAPNWWTDLDSEAQAEIRDAFAEAGVVVVVEQVSDGAFEVQHLGDGTSSPVTREGV